MGTPKRCFWWSQNDNESWHWVDRCHARMITKNTSVRSISPPEKLFCLLNLPTRRAIMLNYRSTQIAQNQGFWLHKKNYWKLTFWGKYKGDSKLNIFWNRFLLAMADRSVSAGIPIPSYGAGSRPRKMLGSYMTLCSLVVFCLFYLLEPAALGRTPRTLGKYCAREGNDWDNHS